MRDTTERGRTEKENKTEHIFIEGYLKEASRLFMSAESVVWAVLENLE